jgi:hypothetical protein
MHATNQSEIPTRPKSEATSRLENRARRTRDLWCYAALLLVIMFAVAVRIRLRNMPLERDEGEYAYMGQLMLQGIPPYKLAFNMKLPGTYAVYALVMGIFGQTVAGIRLGMMLINAASILLVFLLGRKLFGTLAGTVAAATYALLSNRTSMMALDGHATHFVALLAVAGTLFLLHALETKRTSAFFVSGLCYGLSFLMKQPGLFFALFGLFYWAWSERKQSRREVMIRGSTLAAGVAVPFLLMCAILLATGVFPRFWFWAFSYSARYASLVSLADGWKTFRFMLPWVLRPFVISGIAALGLSSLFWNADARKHAVFLISFLLASFLAVCPGLYFRGHYFLLILPGMALLAGIGIAAAQQSLERRNIRPLPSWLPIVFFVLTFLTAVYGHRRFLFQLDPILVAERMHPGERFAEAITVADYVRGHSSDQDSIAILGSEPEIYFYARRHSASGYIYMYSLMEGHEFARRMQVEMIQQIEGTRPRLVVYVDSGYSWGWAIPGAQTKDLFAWMHRYLDAEYEPVARIPLAANVDHLWGDHASFYIFQRKDR